MTPRQFTKAVKDIVAEAGGDYEKCHSLTDSLMETTLIELGYHKGVDLIRITTRFCA